jgi:exopolyphosphatase / guanosine-5'-triphosphate,3'-diphosphate pyrophosphatase
VRCACIDIGSNTTRLLVAESRDGRLQEVLAQRAFTRLGSSRRGGIPDAKVAEVAELVASQVRMAHECGVERIRVVATAAIRQAPNREEFCEAVEAAAGLPVIVLSGDDEARLAFAGATRTLHHAPLGEIGVVDVGGGSSELVVGTMGEGVSWSASFHVGSALLAEGYLRSDPPSVDELDRVRAHVAGVFEGLDVPQPEVAYAVGGSATSLRRLLGTVLDGDALARGLLALAAMPRADIARRFALHPERARLLPAAILLLEGATGAFGTPLRTCGGGLREGVLLEAIRGSGPSQATSAAD